MKNLATLRQQRRSAVRSMTLIAFGGIAGVLAIATVALWINWPGEDSRNTHRDVDPMSMVG